MSLIPTIATSLVAIEHIYIFILEIFLWTKPIGRRESPRSSSSKPHHNSHPPTSILPASQVRLLPFHKKADHTTGTFGLSPTFAEQTKALGQNQGVYNGFLATGLIWAVLHPNDTSARELKLFFLSCVSVIGVVGGTTAKGQIFFVQGLPAMVALGLTWFI